MHSIMTIYIVEDFGFGVHFRDVGFGVHCRDVGCGVYCGSRSQGSCGVVGGDTSSGQFMMHEGVKQCDVKQTRKRGIPGRGG